MILMSLMSEMYPGLRREHDSEVGWRESYAKTNGFVAGDPEICHSHGGTSPAPSPVIGMARILCKNQWFRGKRPRNLSLPWGNEPGPEPGPREWRVSYVKTNVFVTGEPEIRHSHGGARPAPAGHFGGESFRQPPRPPCGVIYCYLLRLLETYHAFAVR